MEFFILDLDKKVNRAIELQYLDRTIYVKNVNQKSFEQLPKLSVAYHNGNEMGEVPDILQSPTLLLSDKLKRILSLYDNKLEFKGVQVFSEKEKDLNNPLYWVTLFPEVDSLHSSSTFYNVGLVNELRLDEKKIKGQHIFKVKDLIGAKIIVSLAVAESILRRRPYGISLEKVEVR